MLSILRWILLLPAVFFAWFNFLEFSISIYSSIEAKYCRSNLLCDSSYSLALNAIYLGAPALSTLVVGVVAIVIAPSHKLFVTWTTFVIGSFTVIALIAFGKAPLISGVTTLITGLISAIFISYMIRKFNLTQARVGLADAGSPTDDH